MRKRANRQKSFPALLVMVLLLSVGCAKKEKPLSPQPSQPKPAAAKPALPVQAQASSAKNAGGTSQLLDFSGKKDPFKPFAAEPLPQAPGRAPAAARTGELLPIQSYDVNKFRIAGIIAGLKENTALIIDPAGRGYVVREGMMIGINDGRISRITPRGVEVIEQYRDDNGHLRKRSVILTLPKKK